MLSLNMLKIYTGRIFEKTAEAQGCERVEKVARVRQRRPAGLHIRVLRQEEKRGLSLDCF